MMTQAETILAIRTLPRDIDYYVITSDGTLEESTVPSANIYIDGSDVCHLGDEDVSKHLRTHYGRYVGVMRSRSARVLPRFYTTSRILLGLVEK